MFLRTVSNRLLDDLPDLPEDRERKLRARETPDQTKARHRASLLSDLPDLPEEGQRRSKPDAPADDEPDIPKIDAAAETAVRSGQTPPADTDTPPGDPSDDPFADIHWNNDQTTFTIRL